MSNVLLWRHAEAEVMSQSGLDMDRKLSPKGEQDALKMATWLVALLPPDCLILTSPALRCQQTANALNQVNPQQQFLIQVAEDLNVESYSQDVLDIIEARRALPYFLMIGHQPYLGEVICQLIDMSPVHCAVKKGAVWWIKTRQHEAKFQRYLYALQQPALSLI